MEDILFVLFWGIIAIKITYDNIDVDKDMKITALYRHHNFTYEEAFIAIHGIKKWKKYIKKNPWVNNTLSRSK